MEEKVAPIAEDDLPSWVRILAPHGLDAFVPKGCVTFFIGVPWWLDVLNILGIAPILVWPRVLEHASPPGLGGIILSDIVCIYPLVIPICVVASTMLIKRNHRTVSALLAALNSMLGLIVVATYAAGALAM